MIEFRAVSLAVCLSYLWRLGVLFVNFDVIVFVAFLSLAYCLFLMPLSRQSRESASRRYAYYRKKLS